MIHTNVQGVYIERYKTEGFECYRYVYRDGTKSVGYVAPDSPKDSAACDVAAQNAAERYGTWPKGQASVIMWNMGERG